MASEICAASAVSPPAALRNTKVSPDEGAKPSRMENSIRPLMISAVPVTEIRSASIVPGSRISMSNVASFTVRSPSSTSVPTDRPGSIVPSSKVMLPACRVPVPATVPSVPTKTSWAMTVPRAPMVSVPVPPVPAPSATPAVKS